MQLNSVRHAVLLDYIIFSRPLRSALLGASFLAVCELLYPAAMAEDQIQVKLTRVSIVAPAIPTVKHRMFLSSIDLSMIATNNIRKVLFYKTALLSDKEFSIMVDTLKRSLSLVLVDFYPFAGRLVIEGGESGRPEVDCNDAGVEFVEASIDMAFEHLEKDEFQHKSFFKELVQTRDETYPSSLLSIQITAFQGGGICIGANFHHVIADGASFWYFMKCWRNSAEDNPFPRILAT